MNSVNAQGEKCSTTGTPLDPKPTTIGADTSAGADVHIVRLSPGTLHGIPSHLTIDILIDVKRQCWCFRPGSPGTWSSATLLDRVDPRTYFSIRRNDGM